METIEINGKSYLIDIEKAIEQGLLKEKDSNPRSWEEYAIRRCKTENFFSSTGVNDDDGGDVICDYDIFNSMDEAKAFCALGKLIQLRDAWWGEWRPDYKPDYVADNSVYNILYAAGSGIITKDNPCYINRILAFPTPEMATDFLETFRDLIEQAKMFL